MLGSVCSRKLRPEILKSAVLDWVGARGSNTPARCRHFTLVTAASRLAFHHHLSRRLLPLYLSKPYPDVFSQEESA